MIFNFLREKKLYNCINFENSLTPKLLLGILLVAAVLRFQGIFWGIPLFDPMVHSYHPDEPKIIKGAYDFPFHILNNTDLRYPTFYHYFLGVFSFPAKILFEISGWTFENFKIYVSVLGRLITILLALGSVYLTFLLGKKLFNEKVGLLSAVFISLSLYHVQNSAWATLDIPNCFFLVLTVYLAFNMYEKRTLKSYILTGVSLGILAGTKYIGAIVLISILILHFRHNEEKISLLNIRKNLSSKNLWLLIISAAIVFLLTTPGIMLKPKSFAHSLLALFYRDAGRGYSEVFDYRILIAGIKNYSIVTDPFLTVAMVLGLLLPFKKRLDKDVPIIVIIIIFLIAFGSLTSRQIIAILPLTSILGARAVSFAFKRLKFISRLIWVTLFFLWISFALVYNLFGIHLRNNDTRTEAAYFIKNTLPEGSSIGATVIGNFKRWDWMFPKINPVSYKIIDALEHPDFLILTSYDYVKFEEALKSDKLSNYSWDPKYSYKWYRGVSPTKEVFQFYDEVLNNTGKKYKYKLIKKFEKNIFIPIEFPPPQLRIYERLYN